MLACAPRVKIAILSFVFIGVATLFNAASIAQRKGPNQQPAYRNANLSVDQRVADLLARMTVEEKILAASRVAEQSLNHQHRVGGASSGVLQQPARLQEV